MLSFRNENMKQRTKPRSFHLSWSQQVLQKQNKEMSFIVFDQQIYRNPIMWIARKQQPRDQRSFQNAEPFFNTQKTYVPQAVPSSLQQPVQQIAANISTYFPLSDIISMQSILASPQTQLKKFRESVFLGEMVDGKRCGMGLMIYVNGRVYQGEWLENFKHGKGFQKFSNGSIYKGDYVNGKPQGCGRYQWQNGELYQGQWVNGLKHGSGIWRGSKGDSYIGQWRQGGADGYGVHTWVNGDRYQGQFKDCLKHGEGVEHFANGDSYKGNYQMGKPSGYGEYYWVSGSFFKGNFKAGLRCGEGMWKKGAGRSDKYEGEWVNDKKEGFGVFTWADGSVYKGYFVNDIKQGQGEILYSNGTGFKGQWKEDRPLQDHQALCEHDEDCQLFMPNAIRPEHFESQPFCIQQLPRRPLYNYNKPKYPQYLNPEHPYLKSASKNIRPRNFTRNTARSQVRSRGEIHQGRQTPGMVKKMSAGTVRGKSELGNRKQKSMSSSFFLYKINGENGKNVENYPVRQTRTSGGSRRQKPQVEEELKYFARSKIGSFTQLH